MLPREDAALIVDGLKVTGDIGDVVRYAKGKEEARAYLVGRKKWSNEKFDEVDWKRLDMCLRGKAQGFNIWLSKQCLGF